MTYRLLSILALSAVAAQSMATLYIFGGTFSGLAEVPPNASPGTGSAYVLVDDVAMTYEAKCIFSGLMGTVTASHVHIGSGPGTAGAVATQTPTFPGFPLGGTSGYYDQTFDGTLTTSWRAGFITASGGTAIGAFNAFLTGLKAGNAYFNVHTSVVPGGEIRADLSSVPEPASALVLTLGALALRRRKAAKA